MSHGRGLRLQNALARYLTTWWPLAESAGAGRPGTDVLGTPGVVWENKTAKGFRPLAFVRQARAHSKCPNGCGCNAGTHDADARECGCDGPCTSGQDGWFDLPVVVYWPEGVGEASVDATLSILPTGVLVRLLKEAGY